MVSFMQNLPPFIQKLCQILNNPRYFRFIRWSPSGNTILILEESNFSEIVLSENFKHSNLNSFIRQLNKYNFHKIKSTEETKNSNGQHIWEFSNVNFKKSRPDLMINIIRKRSDCIIKSPVKRLSNKPFMETDSSADSHKIQSFPQNTFNPMVRYENSYDAIIEEIRSIKGIVNEIRRNQIIFNKRLMNISNEPVYNILILEDNVPYVSFIYQCVKNYGYNPTALENANDLQVVLNKKKFDVIILSIKLHNIQNIVSSIREFNDSIVILLTSNRTTPSEEIFKAYRGVSGVIFKPFMEDELIDLIKKAVIRR